MRKKVINPLKNGEKVIFVASLYDVNDDAYISLEINDSAKRETQ